MRSTNFLKICLALNSDVGEALSNFLFECGALGIIENENELEAYFNGSLKAESILTPLKRYMHSLQAVLSRDIDISISTERIPQRDWNAEWKNSLRPIFVTENILVKPSWTQLSTPVPRIVLEIDPEMAFGSGEHATTKLTLRLIEKNVQPHSTLLDVGTGTGILAIAALKLGAHRAYAFDIDPIAAQTAWRNAQKNGVSRNFFVFAGMHTAIRQHHFDLIAANVSRLQIVSLLPHFADLLVSNGLCLLSGLLEGEEQMIRSACRENGFAVQIVLREQEWLAFETRKK